MQPAAPLSMWALFQHADFVVQFVMIGLIVASIAVWAVLPYGVMMYSWATGVIRPIQTFYS